MGKLLMQLSMELTCDWINIHTHKAGNGIYILDKSAGNGGLDDYHGLCSLGIHPMYMDIDIDSRLKFITLAAAKRQIVAIGEAGLDRNASVGLELQKEVFKRQVEIAEHYQMPVIIHCVRAYPELITLYKISRPKQAWIIHGFNNNGQILAELLRHGLYVSIGKNVLNDNSNLFGLLKSIPLDQLFLETDDADVRIETIYDTVSREINITPEKLKKQVCINFEQVFNIAVNH